jgi:hypothetical protein
VVEPARPEVASEREVPQQADEEHSATCQRPEWELSSENPLEVVLSHRLDRWDRSENFLQQVRLDRSPAFRLQAPSTGRQQESAQWILSELPGRTHQAVLVG